MVQYAYRYCKIDTSIYQCIIVYQSIMLCLANKRFKNYIFVENDMRLWKFILEKITSLLSGITTGKADVYSNALKSSDVS